MKLALKEMGTSQLLWEKYMGKAKLAVCSVPYYLKKSLSKHLYS